MTKGGMTKRGLTPFCRMTSAYHDGIQDDPDSRLQINEPLFSYAIVNENGDSVLQATDLGTSSVPEPTGCVVILMAASGVLLRRRRAVTW